MSCCLGSVSAINSQLYMPGVLIWACTGASLHRHFNFSSQVAGPAPVVLVMIVRHTSAPTNQFIKTGFITHKSLRVHGTSGVTQQGHGHRKREQVHRPGVLPLLGLKVWYLGFCRFILCNGANKPLLFVYHFVLFTKIIT